MSLPASFTFGCWCKAFFLWLSFVSFARGEDIKYIVMGGDVSVTRGSASPTTVPIQVMKFVANKSINVAMTIGFKDSNKGIQCKINEDSCYDQGVSVSSNGTTYISLKAPVSKDDVIQDTVVILEPIQQDTEVTLVQVSDGTATKENVTSDQIQWHSIIVTLRDNRSLRVGFTRKGIVRFDENGTAELYVMNYDTPLHLSELLQMNIIVRRSDDKSYVSQTAANLSFPEHNISAPILIVDLELDYSQQYEATIVLETQNNNVQLDPSTVRIAYNPCVELVKLMKKLEAVNKQSVQNELQMLESVVKNLTIAPSATADTNTKTKSAETTTTTEKNPTTATTIPPQTTETTEFNQKTTTELSITTTGGPMTPTNSTATKPEPRTTGTTGSVDKSNLSTTEEDVESAENTDSNDTFMWWILAGFVVLMVVTVSGYLLYNHRAKVMVYVGSVWKGNSDKLPTTGQPNRRKNKYTPLPTSIHDTLTHED